MSNKRMKRISAWILCAGMIAALLPTVVFADTAAEDREIIVAEQAEQDVPEWASDNWEVSSQAPLNAAVPERFYLRDYGWSTPVKLQNPWGSCWAFGAIAAAESSILSSGLVDEDYPLDLSERHLVWNVFRPITALEDPAQVGEGLYAISNDMNAPFNAGGGSVMASALFASGSGPIEEGYFPYWGKNQWLSTTYPREESKAYIENTAPMMGMTAEQLLNLYKKNIAEKEGKDPGEVTDDDVYDLIAGSMADDPTYSLLDDWSVPATFDDGSSTRLINEGWVLKNANTFPAYWTDTDELSEDAVHSMKQELLNGRGIAISYHADQSGQYVASAEFENDGTYGENVYGGVQYAQYVNEKKNGDHSVCIIGWDDNFKKENFKEGTQPPGDGAWIVKNSWGSEADAAPDANGNIVNKGSYGAYNAEGKTTGVFYLSYYDRSLGSAMESFEFSSNLSGNDRFEVLQYDYLPAVSSYYTKSQDTLMSTANVFTTEEDADLTSISTRTKSENTRATYSIIRLNEKAKDPSDGTLLYRRSVNFEYGGFHRIDLDQTIRFRKGERFAVVVTGATVKNDGTLSYEISTSRAFPQETAEAIGAKYYAQSVINEGESFLYYSKDGADPAWYDWSAVAAAEIEAMKPALNGLEISLDNFSIKAYLLPVEEEPVKATPEVTLSRTAYTYNGKVRKPKVTVKVNGEKLSTEDYDVSYPSGCKKVGSYTVKVTLKNHYSGSNQATYTINPKGTSLKKLTAASKGFTAKWAKQTTQTTGYQLQYSTKSNFKTGKKTITVSNKKTNAKKITGLKSGRKYYVRVRTYKKVNGRKYYSAWSAVKSVKTQ